jgi:hypothetical protein
MSNTATERPLMLRSMSGRTDTAVVEQPITLEPTNMPETPKPGWLTTEFIGTVLAHGLSVLAILLDLLHVNWSRGLSGAE